MLRSPTETPVYIIIPQIFQSVNGVISNLWNLQKYQRFFIYDGTEGIATKCHTFRSACCSCKAPICFCPRGKNKGVVKCSFAVRGATICSATGERSFKSALTPSARQSQHPEKRKSRGRLQKIFLYLCRIINYLLWWAWIEHKKNFWSTLDFLLAKRR